MRQVSRLLAGLTAVGAAAFTLVGVTAANAASSTVYVSKHGHAGAFDRSCATARYRHINQAIHAAPRGGRVVVCGGTYKVQAVVTKSLALVGRRGATIDAKGQKPISKKLPGGSGVVVFGARNVEVTGFTVKNAGFDAILVARSRRVLVSHNLLKDNGDVGVDFNGSSDSLATHNLSELDKGGGFLMADNEIYGNGLAGVTIHSHVPGQRMSGNQIVGNDIGRNNIIGDPIGLAPPVTNHPDLRTTGILVGASSAIRVWIHGNYIHSNWFGIYLNGRIRAHIFHNRYHRVHKHIKVA